MFNGGNGISLADIAALMNNNGNNNGFGDGAGGWWVLIILLALFGGFGDGGFFGNRGNGNGNCNNGCNGGNTTTYIPVPMGGYGMFGNGFAFSEAAMQRGFDNSTVISKLDGITNGLCSLGYDQLIQQNGTNSNIQQLGFNIVQALNTMGMNDMQSFNALTALITQCCCENRQGQGEILNAISQLLCGLQNTMNQNTQAIMQNDNTNARTMHDEIFAMRMEDKNETIAMLRQQLNNCDRDGALSALENRLVARLDPPTNPSYLTCNPATGNVIPQAALAQIMSLINSCGCCNN